MFVIVPTYLVDAINCAIDEQLAGRPCFPEEREGIYNRILAYYDEHGAIPSFTLNDASASDGVVEARDNKR